MRLKQAELKGVKSTINLAYSMVGEEISPLIDEHADGSELISLWVRAVSLVEAAQSFKVKYDSLENKIKNSKRQGVLDDGMFCDAQQQMGDCNSTGCSRYATCDDPQKGEI